MTTGMLTIRPATAADRDAVIALSRAISPDDYIPEVYDDWLQDPGGGGLFVVELDGRIVACYALEFPRPGQAYLEAMRVDPTVQGRGLGSKVCRLQVEQACAMGAQDICLLSALHNHPAHRIVEKNGFRKGDAWLVYDELKALPPLPVGRARLARPGEVPRRADGVIASRQTGWVVIRASDADWDQGETAVVSGPGGIEGFMLFTPTDYALLIRRLEGAPEAAADLLGLAVREMRERSLPCLSISLPLAAEPLLAPLRLDPAQGFRAYVFHHEGR